MGRAYGQGAHLVAVQICGAVVDVVHTYRVRIDATGDPHHPIIELILHAVVVLPVWVPDVIHRVPGLCAVLHVRRVLR
jgi:hypothetical protein